MDRCAIGWSDLDGRSCLAEVGIFVTANRQLTQRELDLWGRWGCVTSVGLWVHIHTPWMARWCACSLGIVPSTPFYNDGEICAMMFDGIQGAMSASVRRGQCASAATDLKRRSAPKLNQYIQLDPSIQHGGSMGCSSSCDVMWICTSLRVPPPHYRTKLSIWSHNYVLRHCIASDRLLQVCTHSTWWSSQQAPTKTWPT